MKKIQRVHSMDAEKLQILHDSLVTCVNNIRREGGQVVDEDYILEWEGKLPEDILWRLNDAKKNDKWTTQQFFDFLQQQIDTQQKVELAKPHRHHNHNNNQQQHQQHQQNKGKNSGQNSNSATAAAASTSGSTSTATAAGASASSGNQASKKKGKNKRKKPAERKCPVCEVKGHDATACQDLITLDKDAQLALCKKLGVCTTCLRGRHPEDECYSKNKEMCDNCKMPHHSLFHDILQPNYKA